MVTTTSYYYYVPLQKRDGYFNKKCFTSVACIVTHHVIDNLMAVEQMLRGEPNGEYHRHID